MKLGLTSLTFRKRSIRETAEIAASLGLSGIEWGVSDLHMNLGSKEKAQEIKALSAEYGLEVFSLGSYCTMTDYADCVKNLQTAAMLDAPIIRVWAGEKASAAVAPEEYKRITENAAKMADDAVKYGITLGFEYHRNTLTDTAEGAVRLVRDIGADNAKLYWQQDSEISLAENEKNLLTVKPYLCGNLHIHNYTDAAFSYMPLEGIRDRIGRYYELLSDRDYRLMVEFCRKSLPESLADDVRVLREEMK